MRTQTLLKLDAEKMDKQKATDLNYPTSRKTVRSQLQNKRLDRMETKTNVHIYNIGTPYDRSIL